MPKCPYCETKLEECTEITGYLYWLCRNSTCPASYIYPRESRPTQRAADDAGQSVALGLSSEAIPGVCDEIEELWADNDATD